MDAHESAAEQDHTPRDAKAHEPSLYKRTLHSRYDRGAESDSDTVRALWYCPKDVGENAPCLVYYHGGGFVIHAAPYHYSLAREYAQRANCKVLFVDYRLAPKFPFPIPTEDCYAAYRWAIKNAVELSIDPGRVAVAGDSAGGQLATVVCLMAKELGQTMPCGQMLIYPAAGNVETESVRKYTDTPSRGFEKAADELRSIRVICPFALFVHWFMRKWCFGLANCP